MLTAEAACARKEVEPGEAIPAEWGGGVNKWPWALPLLAENKATKPELVGHFAAEAPDFALRIPDQIRYEVFARHFAGWFKDRTAGVRACRRLWRCGWGTTTRRNDAGRPTPKSSVADNDLALGRIVELVSHSPYWDDTAIVALEDDAQAGADHVDAHRSIALIVSKYAQAHGDGDAPVVDSRFYSTVSVIRTMESLLGLPPMNNNDAFASLMTKEFSGPGTQPRLWRTRAIGIMG